MTHDEMAALTDGLTSKSDKIRRLAAAGIATSEIAEFLNIRYQFAYNVIKAADTANTSAFREEVNHPDSGSIQAQPEPSLETLIRLAHSMGFSVTFHPLKGG